MTQARECSVLFDSHQCVNDIACIPVDKIQSILETDLIGCITQLQFCKAKAFCCFAEKRKDDHSKNAFPKKWGGGPKGPRKRGALAPHLLEKKRFSSVHLFFFLQNNKMI